MSFETVHARRPPFASISLVGKVSNAGTNDGTWVRCRWLRMCSRFHFSKSRANRYRATAFSRPGSRSRRSKKTIQMTDHFESRVSLSSHARFGGREMQNAELAYAPTALIGQQREVIKWLIYIRSSRSRDLLFLHIAALLAPSLRFDNAPRRVPSFGFSHPTHILLLLSLRISPIDSASHLPAYVIQMTHCACNVSMRSC